MELDSGVANDMSGDLRLVASPGPSKRARVAVKWMKRTTRLRIAEW
jgi:hypothetical protein